jgi:hypothetical protein
MAVNVSVVNSGSLTWMTTPLVRSAVAGGVVGLVTSLMIVLLLLLLLLLSLLLLLLLLSLLLLATVVLPGVTTGAAVRASNTLKAGPAAAGSAVPLPPTGSPAALAVPSRLQSGVAEATACQGTFLRSDSVRV